MPTPDDQSQSHSRFASLDRRTYLHLQAAGIIATGATGATGVGSAETGETGYGRGGFGEGGYGQPIDNSDPSPSPPNHSNSRFSSTSSTRFSSVSSADYDSDS